MKYDQKVKLKIWCNNFHATHIFFSSAPTSALIRLETNVCQYNEKAQLIDAVQISYKLPTFSRFRLSPNRPLYHVNSTNWAPYRYAFLSLPSRHVPPGVWQGGIVYGWYISALGEGVSRLCWKLIEHDVDGNSRSQHHGPQEWPTKACSLFGPRSRRSLLGINFPPGYVSFLDSFDTFL